MDFYEPQEVSKIKILPPDYVQDISNMSAQDFLKIYLETLRYQDPFNQTDISKSLDDMVKINQVQYFTQMKQFLESLKLWMNQMTFLNTVNLIGKEFIFKTDTLDTIKRDTYYIVSDSDKGEVSVRIYDGDEVIKEFKKEIKKGINELDVSSLPDGQFTVKIFKEGNEVRGWNLGFKDSIKSVGIINNELILDLASGVSVSSDRIIYVGG